MKDIVDFLYRYFHTYDITTEVVMIGIIFILATISFYSKPERTYMTKYYYRGLFFSAVSMIFHIWMLGETIKMQDTHNFHSFYVLYFLFSVSYICVLEVLFIYHSQLSFVRRGMKKQLRITGAIFGVFWLTILLLPVFTGKLLEYKDGRYVLTFYSNAYVLCSFTCLILITYVTLSNKKNVARIVHCGSMIFIPLEFLAVSSQLYFPTAYFICATYTLPFLIYFLLFHCQKYDEITGCQGPVACRTILKKYITSRKEFIVLNVSAPTIETRNLAEIRSVVFKVIK